MGNKECRHTEESVYLHESPESLSDAERNEVCDVLCTKWVIFRPWICSSAMSLLSSKKQRTGFPSQRFDGLGFYSKLWREG